MSEKPLVSAPKAPLFRGFSGRVAKASAPVLFLEKLSLLGLREAPDKCAPAIRPVLDPDQNRIGPGPRGLVGAGSELT